MAFVAYEKVVQFHKCLLESFLIIFSFVLFVRQQVYGHVLLAKHGHLLTTVAVEHSEQGVAVSKIKSVNVRILIRFSPSLH